MNAAGGVIDSMLSGLQPQEPRPPVINVFDSPVAPTPQTTSAVGLLDPQSHRGAEAATSLLLPMPAGTDQPATQAAAADGGAEPVNAGLEEPGEALNEGQDEEYDEEETPRGSWHGLW